MSKLVHYAKNTASAAFFLLVSGTAFYGASMNQKTGTNIDKFCLNTTPGVDPLSAFVRGGCGLIQHTSIGAVKKDGTFIQGCSIDGCDFAETTLPKRGFASAPPSAHP